MEGIPWRWRRIDGAMTRAPRPGNRRPEPDGSWEKRSKRHLLADGRSVLLWLILTVANRFGCAARRGAVSLLSRRSEFCSILAGHRRRRDVVHAGTGKLCHQMRHCLHDPPSNSACSTPSRIMRGNGSPGLCATRFVPVERAQTWNSSSEAT